MPNGSQYDIGAAAFADKADRTGFFHRFGLFFVVVHGKRDNIDVRQLLMDSVSIFILPPSYEVLRQRLIARGTDSPEELEVRLRTAPLELKQYSSFDYVIINDEIGRAAAQLASIIYAERARCMRQEPLVREVISKFKSNSIIDS